MHVHIQSFIPVLGRLKQEECNVMTRLNFVEQDQFQTIVHRAAVTWWQRANM